MDFHLILLQQLLFDSKDLEEIARENERRFVINALLEGMAFFGSDAKYFFKRCSDEEYKRNVFDYDLMSLKYTALKEKFDVFRKIITN